MTKANNKRPPIVTMLFIAAVTLLIISGCSNPVGSDSKSDSRKDKGSVTEDHTTVGENIGSETDDRTEFEDRDNSGEAGDSDGTGGPVVPVESSSLFPIDSSLSLLDQGFRTETDEDSSIQLLEDGSVQFSYTTSETRYSTLYSPVFHPLDTGHGLTISFWVRFENGDWESGLDRKDRSTVYLDMFAGSDSPAYRLEYRPINLQQHLGSFPNAIRFEAFDEVIISRSKNRLAPRPGERALFTLVFVPVEDSSRETEVSILIDHPDNPDQGEVSYGTIRVPATGLTQMAFTHKHAGPYEAAFGGFLLSIE